MRKEADAYKLKLRDTIKGGYLIMSELQYGM